MFKIYHGDQASAVNVDDYYIKESSSGLDELVFEIPITDENYPYILEEAPVVEQQKYIIKAVDADEETAKVKCQLDIDEWLSDMYIGFTNGSDTLYNTVQKVLPGGWRLIDDAHLNTRMTIELEAGNSYDVLTSCASAYGVKFRFDNVNRTLTLCIPENNQPMGVFVTRQLNMTELNYKGKSTDFATRMYAYGKDGMTFETLNDGKPYVDDHRYSDKIVSVYWKDDRYTDPQSLLDAAKLNLAALAVPSRSYSCSVADLAQTNPELYSFQDFSLFNVVTLIDDVKGTRINHVVAEYTRYPHYPENNEVTLSTVTPSIQDSVKSIQAQIEKPNSQFRQIMQAAVNTATEIITGNLGGHYIVTNGADGHPNGWAILDTDSIETCQKVWRFTAGGLGHSSNGWNGPYEDVAITMDGQINASMITVGILSANLIQSGILQSLDGDVQFDLENGIIRCKNGQREAVFSNGSIQFSQGDRITIELTSTASGGETDGSITIAHTNPDGSQDNNTVLSGTLVESNQISAYDSFYFNGHNAAWQYENGKYYLVGV